MVASRPGWIRLRRCVMSAFAVGLFGSSGSPLDAQESTGASRDEALVAHAQRLEGPIALDGVLDEPAWSAASTVGEFVQVDPDAGAPSEAATEVRVLWSDEGLFIGAQLDDPDGVDARRVEGLRRDFAYETSDVFGVVLDGFGDGRFAMGFMTNPDGVQRDLLVFDGRDIDEAWNGVWRVRTARTASGWSVEMGIPWATLRYLGAGDWRINFVREARAIQETSGWSPWQRGVEPWDMTYAGRLVGMEPPPPSVNLQIQPYSVGRAEGVGTGLLDDPDRSGDVGLDLKWAVSPNTVVDLTYNMDFAQAEVDRQVINLDRFSVFFPERRTFFLESAGLFDTGLSVISPFYSRRIGLDDRGLPVPVTAGGRVTHRSATSSSGALVVRQAGTGESTGSVFGVGRYVRNTGANGRIGAMVATRHDQGLPGTASALNTAAAVDFFFRPTRTLFARGMVSRSITEGPGGDGWAAYALVGNNAPWGYVGWLQEYIGEEWEPRSGFRFTNDVVVTSPAFNLDLRPQWLPEFIRSYRPGATVFFFSRATTGDFFSGSIRISPVELGFQNGGRFWLSAVPNWQTLTGAFRPVPGVEAPPGEYEYTRWEAGFDHDPSARISGSATVGTGRFYDGDLHTSLISGKAALSPHFVAFASWERNRFRGVGGVDRTSDLFTPEVRVAPSPRLELSGVWQYNTATESSNLNLRLSWEFRPLSFLYVVYNDNTPLDGRLEAFPSQRRLIIKGTWLWQP